MVRVKGLPVKQVPPLCTMCQQCCVYVCVGLYMDAEAAMEFLLARRDIDRRKIIVFGRSLGGAVAIYLAGSPTYVDK